MFTANRFRRFDLGQKAVQGVLDKSLVGALVSIASVTLMAVLVISELLAYIKVDTSSHMAVADFHEHDAVTARLHATFPFVECKDLEVVTDHPQGGVPNSEAVSIHKRPASKAERYPFQPQGGGLGCTLDGTATVERAAGTIVIHVMHHDPSRVIFTGRFLARTKGETRSGPKAVAGQNMTHKIHDFGFGPPVKGPVGVGRNSLARSTFVSEEGSGLVKYSLKVVPISHRRMHGAEVNTHTYSSNVAFVPEAAVLQDLSSSSLLLGVEFSYDFTSVMVKYTDARRSMFELITSVCAIVGGIYTVSGLFVRGLQVVSPKKHD
ncbi:unnamed protein product [Ectocarpus sp. 6 AP-2014]